MSLSFPAVGPEHEFKEHLRSGKFMLQRSKSTGRTCFIPRMAIPSTGEIDLDWVEASGEGVVYSITVNRTRDDTYNVALVELEEGPRMLSTILDVETVPIGTKVRAKITELNGEAAVAFVVAEENEND